MNKELIADIKKYVNYLTLPLEDHYYHHYHHALSVMERAVYLWTMEWCNSREIELLAISSLFHDVGFVITYEDNELFGAKIAQNYLRTILYPPEDIAVIEKIILATHPKKEPSNLLEKIIKDADMDNLGRDDFFDTGEKLRRERELIQHIKIRDPDWRHASLELLEWHSFYTATQRKERYAQLLENTNILKKELWG